MTIPGVAAWCIRLAWPGQCGLRRSPRQRGALARAPRRRGTSPFARRLALDQLQLTLKLGRHRLKSNPLCLAGHRRGKTLCPVDLTAQVVGIGHGCRPVDSASRASANLSHSAAIRPQVARFPVRHHPHRVQAVFGIIRRTHVACRLDRPSPQSATLWLMTLVKTAHMSMELD